MSVSRSLPVRIVLFHLLNHQQHAKERVQMAHLHGTPICELSSSRRSRRMDRTGVDADSPHSTKQPGSHRSQRWAFLSGSALTRRVGDLDEIGGDQEKGKKKGGQAMTRIESHVDLVSDCRDRSQAAWLHFPHIELLFLFFAFEGAVASEVAALRDSRCPWVIIAAATTLVSRLHDNAALFACLQDNYLYLPRYTLTGTGVSK